MVHSRWNAQHVLIEVATFPRTGIKLLKTDGGFTSYCLAQNNRNLFRWLYRCFLAVDANFRLKLKNREISDPETGSGWSYFVENERYGKHVSRKAIEEEVSLGSLY